MRFLTIEEVKMDILDILATAPFWVWDVFGIVLAIAACVTLYQFFRTIDILDAQNKAKRALKSTRRFVVPPGQPLLRGHRTGRLYPVVIIGDKVSPDGTLAIRWKQKRGNIFWVIFWVNLSQLVFRPPAPAPE